MSKLSAFKLVARVIVGAGSTTISRSIIQNNVQPSNVIENITITAASVVIGHMAADATKDYTSRQIDAVVDAWNNRSSAQTDPATA